jgi:hypothetical protein
VTEVVPDEFAASRGVDARTAAVEKDVVRVEIRVTALELWKNAIEIANAARAEREKGVDEKLAAIGSTLTWLNRLIIGAIVMAMLLFALKGGFNLPNV